MALQVISNIKNLEMLTTPASANPIVDALYNMANFKMMENEFVKRYLRMYVFKEFKGL